MPMIGNKKPLYFDLETTGFSGFEDKLLSAVFMDDEGDKQTFVLWNHNKEKQFIMALMDYLRSYKLDDKVLVSYNGENWRGGFDIPFLRSKAIRYGLTWTLTGISHFDLLPLVKKRISTHHYIKEEPSKSNLYKKDLVALADANGLEYTNKNDTFDKLVELKNCDWLDYIKEECKEENGLQNIYQLIFDPELKEEYLDGGDIPEFYEAGEYEKIIYHNENDVVRLKDVAEIIIPTIPQFEIDKNINIL